MNDGTSWTWVELYYSIANLTFFSEKVTFISKLFATMDSVSKKSQTGPAGQATSSQLYLCRAHQRSLQLKSVAAILLTNTSKSQDRT